ncbi:MAG: YbjN domain-containing protein [Elusimicrobia bacterium]|nr:YbjN domain-containing protein [Elusimicrobiota bacterium]
MDIHEKPRLLSAVELWLKSEDWRFVPIDGESAFRMDVQGKSGIWTCFARTDEDREIFMFHSVLPNRVPEGRRPAAAEFLTRANYGMLIGNFEMDYGDGEVRFKTSLCIADGTLTPGMICKIVSYNLSTLDRYLGGLNKVVYGDADPARAIHEIEK